MAQSFAEPTASFGPRRGAPARRTRRYSPAPHQDTVSRHCHAGSAAGCRQFPPAIVEGAQRKRVAEEPFPDRPPRIPGPSTGTPCTGTKRHGETEPDRPVCKIEFDALRRAAVKRSPRRRPHPQARVAGLPAPARGTRCLPAPRKVGGAAWRAAAGRDLRSQQSDRRQRDCRGAWPQAARSGDIQCGHFRSDRAGRGDRKRGRNRSAVRHQCGNPPARGARSWPKAPCSAS